jgi:hypothetical protein
MNELSDEEKQLRDILTIEIAEPPAVEKVLEVTARQANIQTGARDLLTLAISSFFACILGILAPVVAASAVRKKQASNSESDQ